MWGVGGRGDSVWRDQDIPTELWGEKCFRRGLEGRVLVRRERT